MYQDIRYRRWLILGVLALAAGVTFWKVGNWAWAHPNFESAIEVCEGIARYFKPDLGYADNAFHGYPARQYLLVALPSIFCGKSLWSMQIGFAVLFFSGFAVFLYGVRDVIYRQMAGSDTAAALTGVLLFAFPVMVSWLFVYEQTILAVAFLLHATGWLFLACRRLNVATGAGLLWSGCMLGTTYTSAYSVWGLLLLGLAWFIYCRRNNRPRLELAAYVALGFSIFVFGALAFSTKPREALALNLTDFFEKLVTPFFAPAVPTTTVPFIHSALIGFILLFLLASAIGLLGKRFILLMVWMVAVVVMAIILHGTSGNPDFLVQVRTLPIIPVLVTAMVWAWVYRVPKLWTITVQSPASRRILLAFVFAIVAHSLYISHIDSSPKLTHRAVEQTYLVLQEQQFATQPVNAVNLLDKSFFVYADYFNYFAPDSHDVTNAYRSGENLTDKNIMILSESPQAIMLNPAPPGWMIERYDRPIAGTDGQSEMHIVLYRKPQYVSKQFGGAE